MGTILRPDLLQRRQDLLNAYPGMTMEQALAAEAAQRQYNQGVPGMPGSSGYGDLPAQPAPQSLASQSPDVYVNGVNGSPPPPPLGMSDPQLAPLPAIPPRGLLADPQAPPPQQQPMAPANGPYGLLAQQLAQQPRKT